MKKLFYPFLLAALTLSILSCSNNDTITANEVVQQSFSQKYPDAANVKWEQKRNHYVAEFRLSQHEKEAWFDMSGNWKLTETEMPYADLPAAIKTSHEAGEYKDWRVDDVDYIERGNQESFYVLEVEKGELEYDLYYLADGSLIKAFPDNDNDNDYLPKEIPAKITQFLTEKYPGHKIVDTDTDDGRIEIDFIDGTSKRDAVFTLDGNWLRTSTDIRLNNVPQSIKNVLAASAYASYRVDDVEFVETSTGNYYDFELESGNIEVEVRIHENGELEVMPG
ncbi:MAG TPA: PepSY-like domain-containing protein [Niabella sp.]|nr:PepSY-like domain-containing protein [Niabella sp.]